MPKTNTIACAAGDMTRALKDVVTIAKKGASPIFANVVIEADNGVVTFIATNGDQEIAQRCFMNTAGKISTSVEAERLAKIASSFDPSQMMRLAYDNDIITVTAPGSKYTFQTLPLDTFPRLARKEGETFTAGEDFMAALEGVRHAVGTSEVQWDISGVALHVEDGKLDLFATDSNRMAIRTLGSSSAPDCIVPTAAIDLVMRAKVSEMAINITDRVIWFEYGDTVVASKVIDAKVKPYARLLGMEASVTLTFPRTQIIAALGRLLLVSDDKDKSVTIDVTDAKAEHATLTNAAGEEHVTVTANDAIRIGFKAQFLREAFASLSGDEVKILVANPNAPVIIRSPGDPDATLICGTFRV